MDETNRNSETIGLTDQSTDYQVLLYRYLDGWMNDETNGAVLDQYGNIYLTGFSESEAFMGTLNSGVGPAYAAKLSHCGEVIYSTFIPGGKNGADIAVDDEGYTYIIGTTSGGLPVTPGAYQSEYLGQECGFLVKLNPDGDQILYASYFGSASGTVTPIAIALDKNSNVLVTGFTDSPDFPAETLWSGGRGASNAFLLMFHPSGGGSADLVYSYAIGGNAPEDSETKIWSVKTDASSMCYVVGQTTASNFYTMPGAIRSEFQGESEGFIVKLSPTGELQYSTYFGGSGSDSVTDIALDAEQNIYVAGETSSPGLATPGAFLQNLGSSYVAKLNVTENLYSIGYFTYYYAFTLRTFVPANNNRTISASYEFVYKYVKATVLLDLTCRPARIAVDQNGCVYLSGNTSGSFPITPDAFETERHHTDAFITKFSSDGSSVLYSSYLGGITETTTDEYMVTTIDPSNPLNVIITIFQTIYNKSQTVYTLISDAFGNIFIAGSTSVPSSVLTEGFSTAHTLNSGYVIKLGEAPPVWPADKNLSVTTLDSSTLKLDWSPASGDATHYRIYQDHNVLDTVTQDTLTYTVTNAPSVSSYYYKIEAGSASGSFTSDGPLRLSDYPFGLSSSLDAKNYIVFNAKEMRRLLPLNLSGGDGIITPGRKTAVIVDSSTGLLKQLDLSNLIVTSETPLGSLSSCQIAGITPDSRFTVINIKKDDPLVRSILTFDLSSNEAASSVNFFGFALGVSPNGSNLVLVRHIDETGLRIYALNELGILSDTGRKVDFPFYAKSAGFSKDGDYAFGTCSEDADLDAAAVKVFSLRIGGPNDMEITSFADFTTGKDQPVISIDGTKIYFGELTSVQIYDFNLSTKTLSFQSSIPIPYSAQPPVYPSHQFMDLNQEEDKLFIPYYNNPDQLMSTGCNTRIFNMEGVAAKEVPDSLGPIDILIRSAFKAEKQAPIWPADSSLTVSDLSTRSLTLNWTPADDPEGVTAYRIYQDTIPIATVSGSVTTLPVSDLTPGTLYHFKVEAENATGILTFYGPEAEATTLINRILASITLIKLS